MFSDEDIVSWSCKEGHFQEIVHGLIEVCTWYKMSFKPFPCNDSLHTDQRHQECAVVYTNIPWCIQALNVEVTLVNHTSSLISSAQSALCVTTGTHG